MDELAKHYYVYFLECIDASIYVGCTTDVKRRLHEHNCLTKGAKYTRMRRPVVLKGYETYSTLSLARRREAAVKRLSRKSKLALIKLMESTTLEDEQ